MPSCASNAESLAERERLARSREPLAPSQIAGQFRALVDRVMGEAGLYAVEHASIAIKQADGDSALASEILRAFRQSLPARYQTETIDTEAMQIERRISSAFREIPGGQILGPTRDYTQRLLEERLASENEADAAVRRQELDQSLRQAASTDAAPQRFQRISDLLRSQGLVKPLSDQPDPRAFDVTRKPMPFPAPRSAALQTLARSETGGMMAIGYSAMRGQGGDHPTIGELRVGWVRLHVNDQRGRRRYLGRIRVTESANISKIKTRKKDPVPYMSLGYGLCFGQNETKAICMGILDRSMRILGDGSPAISQEFSLNHLDGPSSHGFLGSLKLPAYTDMKSELEDLRAAIARAKREGETDRQTAAPAAELA